jgi:translation initiation factor 2B subunit (eIF-2B alpha/beta/delta family)
MQESIIESVASAAGAFVVAISCQRDFSVLQIQRMDEGSALVCAKPGQASSSNAIRLIFNFIFV